MSEEQKEGIVVNPFHKGAEAPQGGEQGNVTPDSAGSSTPSAEQTSGDATNQQSQTPPPSNDQPPVQDTSSALNSPTATSAGTVSDASSTSQSGSSADIVTGTIVPGSVVTPIAPVVVPPSAVTPEAPSSIGTVVKKEESVVLESIQTGISDVDQIVEKLMQNTSIEAKIIINTIKEYIVAMKPGKPVAQKVAIGHQVAFYNAILSAINNLEADFRPTLQSILALLHAHKDGAFKETHVFRYIESVPLSTDHRMGWRKLTTLLKTLANPATRQDLLRQMNFDPLVKHGLSERGRTKLAAFFGK